MEDDLERADELMGKTGRSSDGAAAREIPLETSDKRACDIRLACRWNSRQHRCTGLSRRTRAHSAPDCEGSAPSSVARRLIHGSKGWKVASDHGGATTDIFGSKDAQNSPFRCDAVHPQDATQSSENRLDVVEVEHGENIMLFNPVAKSDLR
ncbi:hypothetical protein ACI6QG_10240 [Roseococcus sp. DSY-14]|uniref:hypothetical protein n=1 Tax=Roseococcus sp. DSY-14 TaxID=3369650 RepID=UPI00387AC984